MSLSINELQEGKWYTTLNGDGKFKYKPVDNGCIKHTKWIHCKNRGEGTISNDNWWRQVVGLADMEEIYKHFPEENPEEKPKDVPKQEDYTGRWVKALRNGANGIGNIKANTYHKLNRKDIASVSGCYNISFDGLHIWSLHPLDSVNWELMPIGFDPNKSREEVLLEEAKRIYPIGCIVKPIKHNSGGDFKYEVRFTKYKLYTGDDSFFVDGNLLLYYEGKWADIAEMPKNNEFPREGKCFTLDDRLIGYFKASKKLQGFHQEKNHKGVAWNNTHYWYFQEGSEKPLYSIDFLNKWIPVKIEEPLGKPIIFGTAGEITNEQQYAMIAGWQNWPSEEKLTLLDVFKPKKSAKMSYIAENSQEARQLSKITKQKSI